MKINSLDNSDRAWKAFVSIDIDRLISSDEGILTGGGGGFTYEYTDFVINTVGETFLNHYLMADGEISDFQSAKLLLGERSNEYKRLMKLAIDIDFFKIELDPPRNTIVRQTAVAHPKYGKHRVLWSMNESPSPPAALVKFDQEIRYFLSKGFEEDFGCYALFR